MSNQPTIEAPLLCVEGLCFAFNSPSTEKTGLPLTVNNFSITVNAGEIVCILGASGCGKTTLLNLIAGLLRATAGTIKVSNPSLSKQAIGYIFQNDALFPWRTVKANLMLACEMGNTAAKSGAEERINGYLRTFHLSEQILKQYPRQLSGGMRQRVSIIQTLMFDPALLLLDEPFSALDYYTKLSLESEFYQLVKEQKKAAVLVTHDIEEAVAMGDRVLIMSAGKLSKEYVINLGAGKRQTETARGMPAFAEHYREIWAELKSVIQA